MPDSTVVLLPRSAQPEMPWANGGGSTRQIAIEPPAGSLAGGFRWRVSQARVERDGPFSRLPGVDRVLWLVSGNGARLDVAGREVVLARPGDRFDFAGEVPITATLLAGPIEDLNVMTSRADTRVDACVLSLDGGADHAIAPAPERLAVVLAGAVRCAGFDAAAGDALRCDGAAPFVVRGAAGESRLLVCRFLRP